MRARDVAANGGLADLPSNAAGQTRVAGPDDPPLPQQFTQDAAAELQHAGFSAFRHRGRIRAASGPGLADLLFHLRDPLAHRRELAMPGDLPPHLSYLSPASSAASPGGPGPQEPRPVAGMIRLSARAIRLPAPLRGLDRSALRASRASRCPLAVRARAVAGPIPDDAPVMTATRPSP